MSYTTPRSLPHEDFYKSLYTLRWLLLDPLLPLAGKMKMNNYGSSVIYGHPQAPTAGRAIIEMIEGLTLVGGGYGLFTGCAAGDAAAAMILKVS